MGGKALLGVLTKMRGGAASGGLAAAVTAAGGVAGDDSGTASPGGADVAAKMRRAAAKRIKYLQAMDAVRDAWLQVGGGGAVGAVKIVTKIQLQPADTKTCVGPLLQLEQRPCEMLPYCLLPMTHKPTQGNLVRCTAGAPAL